MDAPKVNVLAVTGWVAADRPPEYWDEQAAMALDYANERPASDLDGFLSALRDSANFDRLATLARIGSAR